MGHIRWPSNHSLDGGPGVEDVEIVIVKDGESTLPHIIQRNARKEEKKIHNFLAPLETHFF